MIRRYVASLTPLDGAPPPHSAAYGMYAALLEAMESEAAEKLHSAAGGSISQHIARIGGRGSAIWTVNLLGSMAELASPVIESMKTVELRAPGGALSVEILSRRDIEDSAALLKTVGENMDCGRFLLRFVSPCGFKSHGEYEMFPSVPHILGSLRQKWNAAFPFTPADDDDAMSLLTAHVKITGYNLRGAVFKMKGVSIPAFSGTLTLNARLAPPMLRLLRALLSFGVFSGVGIKTALGMGGLEVKEFPRPPSGRPEKSGQHEPQA